MKIESNLAPTAPQSAPPENPALRKAAKSFEAMFVNQLVSAMRKTVGEGGLIPQSQGEKVYQSMLDSEYAQSIAESEQIGLSKVIYEQLVRNAQR
jgi:peptidoglycan hydrolase FlgJ